MTGLDTNVLVRYVVRDDEAQAMRADAVLRAFTVDQPGFVSTVCLVELVWVLRSRYQVPKPLLVSCIEKLLDTQTLIVEYTNAVQAALERFAKARCDFADCLIAEVGRAAGCRETVTFDSAARIVGMRLL